MLLIFPPTSRPVKSPADAKKNTLFAPADTVLKSKSEMFDVIPRISPEAFATINPSVGVTTLPSKAGPTA